MKVAVLDNGIYSSEIDTPVRHFRLLESGIGGMVETESPSGFTEETAHGTICAKIIETYGKPDMIYDICCLSPEGRGDIKSLCTALGFCRTLDADAISLSAGIELCDQDSEGYIRLMEICSELSREGRAVFAAQSNLEYITVPADFPCVYSVEHYGGFGAMICGNFRKSDFCASGLHVVRLGGRMYIPEICNSYTCPYVCALFTRYGLNMPHSVFRSYDMFRYSLRKWLEYCGIDTVSLAKHFAEGGKGSVFIEAGGIKTLIAEKLSVMEKFTCMRRKIHYLELRRRMKYIMPMSGKISAPVLYVTGLDIKTVIEGAEYFASQFMKAGYVSVTASDFVAARLFGIHYVPSEKAEAGLHRLYTSCRADLIIYASEHEEHIKGSTYSTGDAMIEVLPDGKCNLVYGDNSVICTSAYEAFGQVCALYLSSAQ